MSDPNPAVRARTVRCPRCAVTEGHRCRDNRGQPLPLGTAHAARIEAILAVDLTRARAAAAVIAAGLTGTGRPLLAGDCVALATAEGCSREDARAGLEWAVNRRLIRRMPGPRRATWHQLASSPQPAGELPEEDPQGVHGA